MRKHQQRQILELLGTLNEAQEAELYVDCQNGALSIGEYIEAVEGDGTQTVALFEEYCDMLYEVASGEISERQLKKHLVRIENSVRSELKPNKVEIVFFPYQPSMWDSLESIYYAAKDDPQCDAYVVPIPYYELTPDEKIDYKRMHYDGQKYPKNINVIDWMKYNIEERRPDIVYTHYAYDDDGGSISVHPDYYSKRLRQHCDLLVHVPYFVLGGKTMPSYFADLPGVLYAHYVVVQSELVRQMYINHFNNFEKKYNLSGEYGKAQEKFIALGSPKFDKAINSKKEDFELLPEWRSLIYAPDGTQKKLVLYNTHMFMWVNNAEQYFKKLRFVFDAFRSRSDVVLWWRPHPNTEAYFATKLLSWLDEYHKTISSYKNEGWGIYDETPDMHRAIAWTDVYYGDKSSLLTMYRVKGKPFIVQNIERADDLISLNETISNNATVVTQTGETQLVNTVSTLSANTDGTAGEVIYHKFKRMVL